MKLCLVPLLALGACLAHADARAQSLPMIEYESGTPLVRDPVIGVPRSDPESEMVVYRVMDFNLDAADIPFFVDRDGILVREEVADETIARLLSEDGIALYVCRFPSGAHPVMTRPADRARFCTVRRE